MRLCMVTTFYPPYHFGGDGVFVQQLARDLVGAGHEVEVVHCVDAWRTCSGRREPQAGAAVDDGVVVHRLEHPLGRLSPVVTQQSGRPGLKRRALRDVFARGFDVINYHNISLVGGPGVLAMGEARKVYTLHEHWWVCPTHVLFKYTGELCREPDCLRCCLANRTPPQAWRSARNWMARCLSNVDLLMAPSEFTAERHRAWMREARVDVPIEVVPEYSIRLDEAASPPAELPEAFFLYVGRLSRVKGIDRLLATFAKRPDLHLAVIGTPEANADLELEGEPNVHFVGRIERAALGAYYAAARALVFPSACAETFGLAASESLSCGTPVISTRCGGTEDVVDEKVGRLYDTEEELLAHLDELASDAELAERLGAAGRARYEERYTPESYLERYLASLEQLSR